MHSEVLLKEGTQDPIEEYVAACEVGKESMVEESSVKDSVDSPTLIKLRSNI